MTAAGHPIVIRRAELRDAEAVHAIFAGPKAIAGTLQLPYPSVELWRKRLSDVPPFDYLLVATIDGDVVGNLGLHEAGKTPRRRHVGSIGMSVRDDRQGHGVGTALMKAAIELADGWLNYQRLELNVYTDNLAALALYRKFGSSRAPSAPMHFAMGNTWIRTRWPASIRRSRCRRRNEGRIATHDIDRRDAQ
jgi:putative acetyltransferase